MLILDSLKECALRILTKRMAIVVYLLLRTHRILSFTHKSPFHTTYIACCKDFVDFQIELFIETDSFGMTSIDCDGTREYQIQDNGDYDNNVVIYNLL